MLQSSWRWRRRQRRSLMLVCFVIKSRTRSCACAGSWAMLRGQLTRLLPHSASCYFSSSAPLRIKANFQMPSVFRLVIWTLDCFHSSWRVACAASPHPPFPSTALPPPSPPGFGVRAKHQRTRYNGYVCFSPSLYICLPFSLCVCAC